jgi:FxLD family lantipeptide
MTPPASPVITAPATVDLLDDSEFELDLRVIESTAPFVTMLCDTSDNCGSTCSTTACNTVSNDPF